MDVRHVERAAGTDICPYIDGPVERLRALPVTGVGAGKRGRLLDDSAARLAGPSGEIPLRLPAAPIG